MVELIAFKEEDRDFFVKFISGNKWPFHGNSQVSAEEARDNWEKGQYIRDDVRSFWILSANQRVGFIRLFDVSDSEDEFPLFDIRISGDNRQHGIGSRALKGLIHIVFTDLAQRRLEGYTRVDNLAMRRLFEKNLFVKEAHLRQSWPIGEGKFVDTVGYAILKSDWEAGVTTPPNWNL